METTALIDADILVYRVGFTTLTEPEAIARARMNESIEGIVSALKASTYQCFLTSQEKDNFRYQVYPEYKAGRPSEKPTHYGLLREHLIHAHAANVSVGEEADDRLGIVALSDHSSQPVICSIDKDLDQIPGWHYNFVKGIKYEVTPFQGLYKFYHQLLTGDLPVDNIPGIYGIGPKKAEKILAGCSTELEMFNAVKKAYKQHFPESWAKLLIRNGQLLKIRTYEGEIWEFPHVVAQDLSTVPA